MSETTVATIREIGDTTTDNVSLRDTVEKAASVLSLQRRDATQHEESQPFIIPVTKTLYISTTHIVEWLEIFVSNLGPGFNPRENIQVLPRRQEKQGATCYNYFNSKTTTSHHNNI